MTERVAHVLKVACRVLFILGNAALVWLYLVVRNAERPEDLPFGVNEAIWLTIFIAATLGISTLLGTYLSFAMGVDVFGLNRLSRYPKGRPFDGLAPGEEERLRLDWTRGGLGRGAKAGFKLLLTNRRLLAGSSLSSWFLVDLPLDRIRGIERLRPRFGPAILRFHLLDAAIGHRDISLGRDHERLHLEEELSRLGLATNAHAS